jgi:hypothetical protein
MDEIDSVNEIDRWKDLLIFRAVLLVRRVPALLSRLVSVLYLSRSPVKLAKKFRTCEWLC